jgi:hypothetical protein
MIAMACWLGWAVSASARDWKDGCPPHMDYGFEIGGILGMDFLHLHAHR